MQTCLAEAYRRLADVRFIRHGLLPKQSQTYAPFVYWRRELSDP